jgi:hypothetical protein
MRYKIFIYSMLIGILALSSFESCKKDIPVGDTSSTKVADNTNEKIFEKFIMDIPWTVSLATDEAGNDITSSFTGIVCIIRKRSYYDGPVDVIVSGDTTHGEWKASGDYVYLTLDLPKNKGLDFFTLEWKFTRRILHNLHLIPKPGLNLGKKELHLVSI